MNSLYVTLDILPGTTIRTCVEDMVMFAEAHGVSCVVSFNGIRIRVNKGAGTVDEIVQRYEEVLECRQTNLGVDEEG